MYAPFRLGCSGLVTSTSRPAFDRPLSTSWSGERFGHVLYEVVQM